MKAPGADWFAGFTEKQQNVTMKTTIDLPDDLVFDVKLRALRDGRKLKDTFADLLEKGLCSPEGELERAIIGIDEVTGLPVIKGGHPAPPGMEITPQRIFEILLEQEVEWYATPR